MCCNLTVSVALQRKNVEMIFYTSTLHFLSSIIDYLKWFFHLTPTNNLLCYVMLETKIINYISNITYFFSI